MFFAVNVIFAVNAVNISNTLTNGNLINKLKDHELNCKLSYLLKTNGYIGPVRYVNFTNRYRTNEKRWNVPSPSQVIVYHKSVRYIPVPTFSGNRSKVFLSLVRVHRLYPMTERSRG